MGQLSTKNFQNQERYGEVSIFYLKPWTHGTKMCRHWGHKGNSVQEACNKCFAVHISKFEILQNRGFFKRTGVPLTKNADIKVGCWQAVDPKQRNTLVLSLKYFQS